MEGQEFKWAAEYAAIGWRVAVCHKAVGGACTCFKGAKCGTPGKHPVLREWEKHATTDEEVLAEMLDGSEPRNIGVQMGPESGIIDIEFDCDAGRLSASRYGLDKCHTPTFTSARSTHRLFKYDERLPQQGVIKIEGLEIRIGGGGKAAQSIMPPSSHASGSTYAWVDGMSPGECEVASIPRELMIAICNNEAAAGPQPPARAMLHTTHEKGDRHPSLIRLAARECLKMEDVHDPVEQQDLLVMLRAVNQQLCIPPKSDDEIDALFHSELAWATKQRAKGLADTTGDRSDALQKRVSGETDESDGEAEHRVTFVSTGLEYREGEWWPGDWSLTVVHSDPVCYALRVPVYRSHGGEEVKVFVSVWMDAETYRSAAKVAQAILEATHTVIVDSVPKEWSAMWNGCSKKGNQKAVRGLKAKLMDACKQEAATAENCRFCAVAGWLLEVLTMTPKPDDDEEGLFEADPAGYPAWVRGKTGEWELWFGWRRAWETVDRGRRNLQDGDALKIRKMILAATGEADLPTGRAVGEGGRNLRYIRFSERHIQFLEGLAAGEFSEPLSEIFH